MSNLPEKSAPGSTMYWSMSTRIRNVIQSGILNAIKPDGKGVTVVGDDAQSIYSFRAAEVENILGFPDQYMPTAQVITPGNRITGRRNLFWKQPNSLIAEKRAAIPQTSVFQIEAMGARPRYVFRGGWQMPKLEYVG